MKNYFLTLDLEEWYHLEYLKEYSNIIGSKQSYINQILSFFYMIRKYDIKLTVFVVGETALENRHIIKEIYNLGHEIGCHSYSHNLVNRMKDSDFKEETLKAKQIIEDIIGEKTLGYRAPCFSMDTKKLEILQECGFEYDASLIRFSNHSYYNVFDVSDFQKTDSLIYEKNGFCEFEIPTLKIGGKCIPISGGGYFRMFPLTLTKKLITKYMENENNFVFYIHPFELSNESLNNIVKSGLKNWFRFQVGRKNNLLKFEQYLRYVLKMGFKFRTFKEYINR